MRKKCGTQSEKNVAQKIGPATTLGVIQWGYIIFCCGCWVYVVVVVVIDLVVQREDCVAFNAHHHFFGSRIERACKKFLCVIITS